MEESRGTAGRFYRPELDVVRFLAFLFVFLHHSLPDGLDPRVSNFSGRFRSILDATTNACAFGLSLFFTLSAFLIFELLFRERNATGTVVVKQFYFRRILRIWPLYYLGVVLGLMIALLPPRSLADVVALGWFSIFMGAWQAAIHGASTSPMGPLWSISVEEQFYLFAPWVAKYFNRKSLYGFCATLLIVSNVWLYYLGSMSVPDHRVWCDSIVQFECFAAGILLSLVLNGLLPGIALRYRAILLMFAMACWFFAVYSLHARFAANGNPGSWHLIGGYALAAAGSVSAMVAFLGISPKLLPGWAIYLGRISFGLYVYHQLAIHITESMKIGHRVTLAIPGHLLRIVLSGGLDFALSLGLTFVMAAISYRWLETPFLKMKKRHSVIESQPILGNP